MGSLRMPEGWLPCGSHPEQYEMGVDSQVRCGELSAVCVQSDVGTEDVFGTLMQQCSARHFVGKRVRLAALVRTENVSTWAGLWLRIDGDGEPGALGFDNMQDRPIIGTSNWTLHSVVLDVPLASWNLFYGILLCGSGKVWIAGLRLNTVGLDVPTTNLTEENYGPDGPSNLDFSE